jgi:protein-tyrosine-phosphatase
MSLFEIIQHRRARVLFVSQTNACRGQIAEAFARTSGEDVMLAFSAGVWPAESISDATRSVMAEAATPLHADQAPKVMSDFDLSGFDVVVNLSACRLTVNARLLEPFVPAPLAGHLDSHREVRDRVENFVRFLAEHFRRAREWSVAVDQAVTSMAKSRVSPGAGRQTTPDPPPAPAPQPDAAMQAAF